MIVYDQTFDESDARIKIHNRFFGRKFGSQPSDSNSNGRENTSIDKKQTWGELVPTMNVLNKSAEPFLVSEQLKGWKLTSETNKQYVLDLVVQSQNETNRDLVVADYSKLSIDHMNAIELRKNTAIMQSIRRIGTARIAQGLSLKSKKDISREALQIFEEQSSILYDDKDLEITNQYKGHQKPEQDSDQPDDNLAQQPLRKSTAEFEKRKQYTDAIKYFNKLAKGSGNNKTNNEFDDTILCSRPQNESRSSTTEKKQPNNKFEKEIKNIQKVIKKEIKLLETNDMDAKILKDRLDFEKTINSQQPLEDEFIETDRHPVLEKKTINPKSFSGHFPCNESFKTNKNLAIVNRSMSNSAVIPKLLKSPNQINSNNQNSNFGSQSAPNINANNSKNKINPIQLNPLQKNKSKTNIIQNNNTDLSIQQISSGNQFLKASLPVIHSNKLLKTNNHPLHPPLQEVGYNYREQSINNKALRPHTTKPVAATIYFEKMTHKSRPLSADNSNTFPDPFSVTMESTANLTLNNANPTNENDLDVTISQAEQSAAWSQHREHNNLISQIKHTLVTEKGPTGHKKHVPPSSSASRRLMKQLNQVSISSISNNHINQNIDNSLCVTKQSINFPLNPANSSKTNQFVQDLTPQSSLDILNGVSNKNLSENTDEAIVKNVKEDIILTDEITEIEYSQLIDARAVYSNDSFKGSL